MNRRGLLPVALFVVMTSTGCMYGIINDEFQRQVEELSGTPPEVIVLEPEALGGVKTVAVPPFRHLAWSPPGSLMEVYRGDGYLHGRVFASHDAVRQLLAERFEETLLEKHVFGVVERSRLNEVLGEQALQQSGLTESTGFEKAAVGAGADAILLGTITMDMVYLPDDPQVLSSGWFAVHIRLIDARTGHILAVGRDTLGEAAPIINDEKIVSAMADRLVTALGTALAELPSKKN